jgi:hypothetical protein
MTQTMSWALFLDDERFPVDPSKFRIARSSEEAIQVCQDLGFPTFITFDHDLGGDDTSMRFLDWLIMADMDSGFTALPEDFSFDVHSQNPVGRDNIRGRLESYTRYRKSVKAENLAAAAVSQDLAGPGA